MNSSKNNEHAEPAASFMGIRTSIWEVVFVVVCGGIGAGVGHSIYSSEAVFGAFFGALLGPSMLIGIVRKKPLRQ